MSLRILRPPFPGFEALGAAWRSLEPAAAPSFFQSWTWVGCLAEERYPDPVLLRAEQDGRLVGLALFNRRRGRLHLAESGDPALDRPFTEHNGPLAAGPEVAAALLRAAWQVPGMRGLVLGGVPPALAGAAGGAVIGSQLRLAPVLDLARLRAAGSDPAAGLSANTRYQLRRSDRHYSGQGPLALALAAAPDEIDAWFVEVVALNEATWSRRGQAGAFATGFLRRFHRTLMARALARGELDLLRVSAGGQTVGLLYNFRHRGVVYAYQSALADPAGQPHARPGLTCHARAIGLAFERGDQAYDFLAGDQRYKRSFAADSVPLVWVELAKPWSPLAILTRLRRHATAWRRPAAAGPPEAGV